MVSTDIWYQRAMELQAQAAPPFKLPDHAWIDLCVSGSCP